MKLPNYEKAIIPKEKLQEYLLSSTHPVGQFKARFFGALGYTSDSWLELENDIRSLLYEDAIITEHTEYGQKYVVNGVLKGPSSKKAVITTVWIILSGENIPRFITTYPRD